MVPINNPPTAPVPMALFPRAPIPPANTNGNSPIIKANEVIRIGLRRTRAASIAASIREYQARLRCSANSTIRMAFLAKSPKSMIKAIWKYTLFSNPANFVVK